MTPEAVPGSPDALLAWAVPVLIGLGSAAVVVLAAALLIRHLRHGPGARRRAVDELHAAGAELGLLDDAVEELDREAALSGALSGAGPASLRRARMTAQHARSDAFELYRIATEPDVPVPDMRRAARALRQQTADALAVIETAQADHASWVAAHVSATDQVAAAARRLSELRDRMGDPDALLRELAARADEDEWSDARRSAEAARTAITAAERHLASARDAAADPARTAAKDLDATERALRRADSEARALEEAHRLLLQAALALDGEIAATRAAVDAAAAIGAGLDAEASERVGAEVRAAQDELDRVAAQAARRPVSANETIARLRERLDIALADAQTVQQRLRGARSALPGTLAAARSALARAEASVPPRGAGIDARVRLDAARQDLAAARQEHDPVTALAVARRAIRQADQARGLLTGDTTVPDA